jgi:hypothetical protein
VLLLSAVQCTTAVSPSAASPVLSLCNTMAIIVKIVLVQAVHAQAAEVATVASKIDNVWAVQHWQQCLCDPSSKN